MTVKVSFEDKWRSVSVDVAWRPLLGPKPLIEVESTHDHVVYGPDPATAISDPVTGDVPLVFFSGDRLQLDYLRIPPPLPLTTAAVEDMWQKLVSSGVPLPRGVAAQGRLLPGTPTGELVLLPDVLDRAHAAARALLARWPQETTTARTWRALELPGGREDLPGTDRSSKDTPGFETTDGRWLPVRTVRRTQGDVPWTARALRTVARRLAATVDEAVTGVGDPERRALVQPFVEVARRATGSALAVDPPMSSWPVGAKQAYGAFRAALVALQPSAYKGAVPRAPLCYLWRLYEAWVGVRCMEIIDALPGYARLIGPAPVEFGEWVVRWRAGDGSLVTAIAQAQVSRDVRRFGGQLPVGVRSISSDLRPDLLVMVQQQNGAVGLSVVDAKRRSGDVMEASSASEAGSKYVWGLRLDQNVPDLTRVDLAAVVLATTTATPTMHDAGSRIVTTRLVPGESEVAFRASIVAALAAARPVAATTAP